MENCDASGIASVANVAASAVSVMLRAGSVKAVARIRAAANVSAIQIKLSESYSTVRSTTAVKVSLLIGLPTVGEILVSFSGLYVDWINVTTSPTSSPTRSPTTYAPTYSPTYSHASRASTSSSRRRRSRRRRGHRRFLQHSHGGQQKVPSQLVPEVCCSVLGP